MEGDHQQILSNPSSHEKDLIQMETENYNMGKEGDPLTLHFMKILT